MRKNLYIDKLVACSNKWLRCLLHPHTYYLLSCLSQTHSKTCKVAIARYQTEDIHLIGIENIHSIDYHRRIGGVFPGCVIILLNRVNGIFQEYIFPSIHGRLREIAIYTFDGEITKSRQLIGHILDISVRYVVRIY